MKKRKFIATSIGLITGSSVATNISKSSVGVSFTADKEELRRPADNVQSIVVDFNSMRLRPSYIDDSKPLKITYGVSINSQAGKSQEKNIEKTIPNGTEIDVSEQLESLKLANLDIEAESVGGYIYVEIDHPSNISETYIERYTISGYGVDNGLTNYWPIKQSDTTSVIEDVIGDKNGELIDSGSLKTNNDTTRAEFSGGYIKLPNVPIQDSFTVSVWCRSQNNTWSESGLIACSRQHNGFIVHANGTSSSWSGYAMENSGENNYQQIGEVNIGSIDNWNHYALSYDHNTKIGKMYLNGSYKTQGELTVNRDTNDNVNIYLGSDDPELGFTERDLAGSVSDFRIYDEVLSDDKVNDLYSLGRT